jgi:hypothetical protein
MLSEMCIQISDGAALRRLSEKCIQISDANTLNCVPRRDDSRNRLIPYAMTSRSVATQGDHRVDPCCANGRHHTGQRGHSRQGERGHTEGERIRG